MFILKSFWYELGKDEIHLSEHFANVILDLASLGFCSCFHTVVFYGQRGIVCSVEIQCNSVKNVEY